MTFIILQVAINHVESKAFSAIEYPINGKLDLDNPTDDAKDIAHYFSCGGMIYFTSSVIRSFPEDAFEDTNLYVVSITNCQVTWKQFSKNHTQFSESAVDVLVYGYSQ